MTPRPNIFSRYFSAYGGWPAICRSGYSRASIIITAALLPLWSDSGWWELSISMLPSMLGFTLAGYTAMLCVGGESFQKTMMKAKLESGASAFLELSSTFVHFMLVQFAGLLAAVLGKVWWSSYSEISDPESNPWVWILFSIHSVIGVLLMTYAGATGVAATMRVFSFSELLNRFVTKQAVGSAESPPKPKG